MSFHKIIRLYLDNYMQHEITIFMYPIASCCSGTFTAADFVANLEGMTPQEFVNLLASPETYYINVHTTAVPPGLIRGQLVADEAITPAPGAAPVSPSSVPPAPSGAVRTVGALTTLAGVVAAAAMLA